MEGGPMNETIARYRDLLAARLGVLEEEIRVTEALYREGHGDFRFVTLENTALFERQIQRIERFRLHLQAMGIEQFETIEEFKGTVLAGLQDLYEAGPILRSAVRMVMECVREL